MQKLPAPLKIVFFDIDHTLYQTQQGTVPASITEQVIPRLKAKKIIPAIATGRCVGAFPEPLKKMVANGDFELLVTINGQHNAFQNQIISHYPLPTARVEAVIAKLQAIGVEYAFVTADEIAVSATNAQIDEALKPIKADYIVAPDYYRSHDVIQMLAFYPESRFAEVAATGVFGEDLKEVRWHAFSVDILNKHNSKARGITDVLAHFGYALENAMAFGDGLNDVEMLEMVGCGVAMGNGDARVKALADFVTLPIDQDGILYGLEKLGVI